MKKKGDDMTQKGSCHCSRIAFEVEGEPEQVIACNCSHCSRKGYLLWFVPRDRLRLLTPESAMATYLFNKHVIRHHFCDLRLRSLRLRHRSRGCHGRGQCPLPRRRRALQPKTVPFDGRSLLAGPS